MTTPLTLVWPDILSEATAHFRRLLQLNTTNPPGNERLAADLIADILAQNGLDATILESAPGRATLVSRLHGDGSLPALLIMGHTDVVTAEPDKWEHGPFSGHMDEAGYIYGRGAVDMKQTVVAHLMAFLTVKRMFHDQGILPKRDLIFMALADEETGGKFGAHWVADHHPHLIQDAEFALNEGGGWGTEFNGKRYIGIQAGEKGTSRFWLRARGKPGHGSVPQPDAGIVKLVGAVHKLGTLSMPVHITGTMRSFFQVLIDTQPADVAAQIQDLLATGDAERILPGLPVDESTRREISAMLRNTAMPTILRGGQQLNVIPDFVEAGIDGRLLPGISREAFLAELRELLGPEYAELEIAWAADLGVPLEVDFNSPLTDVIREVMAEAAPGVPLLPTLLTGGTDAKAIMPLGVKVIGFSPLPPDDTDVFNRAHAHNERLHIDSFHFCVKNTYEIVRRFIV